MSGEIVGSGEIINQDYIRKFYIYKVSTGTRHHLLLSHGHGDELTIDVTGAESLIKFLQSFVDNEKTPNMVDINNGH